MKETVVTAKRVYVSITFMTIIAGCLHRGHLT